MEFGGAEVGRLTPARLRFGLRSRPPKFYRITDRLLKFVAIGSLALALTGIATVLVLSVGVSDRRARHRSCDNSSSQFSMGNRLTVYCSLMRCTILLMFTFLVLRLCKDSR
jgi:hypothetical protein